MDRMEGKGTYTTPKAGVDTAYLPISSYAHAMRSPVVGCCFYYDRIRFPRVRVLRSTASCPVLTQRTAVPDLPAAARPGSSVVPQAEEPGQSAVGLRVGEY
eukprot:473057-Rhodomonas_salina.2